MHSSISNRALVHSLLLGALVLAGSSACSPSDRGETGNDTGQTTVGATSADTQSTAATTSADTTPAATNQAAPASGQTSAEQGVSGYQPMAQDTARTESNNQAGSSEQTDPVAVGDSARIGKPGERLEDTRASEQANEDTLGNQADSGRIRPPEDSTEVSGTGAASAEMARDTNVALAQGDTLAHADTGAHPVAAADTVSISADVDTSTTAVAAAPAEDTSTVQVQLDTTTGQDTEVAVQDQPATDTAVTNTAVAVATADTAVVVGDSVEAGKTGERLEPEVAAAEDNAEVQAAADTGRIRPPEDSTEVLGNVTNQETEADPAEVESRDAAEAAGSGIESTGNIVTGANAVAEITRQGQGCAVVTSPEEVRFDMAGSPVTMNPCGTGTMTLPRIVTGEE